MSLLPVHAASRAEQPGAEKRIQLCTGATQGLTLQRGILTAPPRALCCSQLIIFFFSLTGEVPFTLDDALWAI